MSFLRHREIYRSDGLGFRESGARSGGLHAPTHRFDEFPSRLFLGGLRSRRARFRFTSRAEVYNEGHSPGQAFFSEWGNPA